MTSKFLWEETKTQVSKRKISQIGVKNDKDREFLEKEVKMFSRGEGKKSKNLGENCEHLNEKKAVGNDKKISFGCNAKMNSQRLISFGSFLNVKPHNNKKSLKDKFSDALGDITSTLNKERLNEKKETTKSKLRKIVSGSFYGQEEYKFDDLDEIKEEKEKENVNEIKYEVLRGKKKKNKSTSRVKNRNKNKSKSLNSKVRSNMNEGHVLAFKTKHRVEEDVPKIANKEITKSVAKRNLAKLMKQQ